MVRLAEKIATTACRHLSCVHSVRNCRLANQNADKSSKGQMDWTGGNARATLTAGSTFQPSLPGGSTFPPYS